MPEVFSRGRDFSRIAVQAVDQVGTGCLQACQECQPTFLPAYVAALTGSDLAVGLARGLQYLGMFLSPVVGATVIEKRRRVLPMGFAIGALMRVQILGLALGGLLLPPPWPFVSACLFLGLFGVFLGVQSVVFNVLVSKVIPVEKRGLLLGLRNALAGLTVSVAEVREACLDFVDRLWTGRAFRGHQADEVEDCEYTYYALLALGHLGS